MLEIGDLDSSPNHHVKTSPHGRVGNGRPYCFYTFIWRSKFSLRTVTKNPNFSEKLIHKRGIIFGTEIQQIQVVEAFIFLRWIDSRTGATATSQSAGVFNFILTSHSAVSIGFVLKDATENSSLKIK